MCIRDRAPKVEGAQQQLGRDLTRVLERAEKKAAKMGDNFVVTEHLLMSLAEDKGGCLLYTSRCV